MSGKSCANRPGNRHIFLNPETLPNELYTRPNGTHDGNRNVHYFVAFLLLSYHIVDMKNKTMIKRYKLHIYILR